MTPSSRSPSPQDPSAEASVAERLLNSLVGVTAARVVADRDGGISEVHLLTTSDHSPDEVVGSVLTALRAHLDVVVERSRVSVARVREGVEVPEAPSGPLPPRRRSGGARRGEPPRPAPREERDEEPRRATSRGAGPEREATRRPEPPASGSTFPPPFRERPGGALLDLFPPPWPERSATRPPPEEGGERPSSAPDGPRSRPVGGPPDPGGAPEPPGPAPDRAEVRRDPPEREPPPAEDRPEASVNGGREPTRITETRLVFLGHEAARRREEREVRIRVDLDWKGRTFRGEAASPDEPGVRLRAPAEATIRAIEAALAARDTQEVAIVLRLNGVEMIEAFGIRHVMVSVHAEVDGRSTPLTGTLVVDEHPELSVILATLQATDRSARAALHNHRVWGPPRIGSAAARA